MWNSLIQLIICESRAFQFWSFELYLNSINSSRRCYSCQILLLQYSLENILRFVSMDWHKKSTWLRFLDWITQCPCKLRCLGWNCSTELCCSLNPRFWQHLKEHFLLKIFMLQLFRLQKPKAQFFHLGLNQKPCTNKRVLHQKNGCFVLASQPWYSKNTEKCHLFRYISIFKPVFLCNYGFDFSIKVSVENFSLVEKQSNKKSLSFILASESWEAEISKKCYCLRFFWLFGFRFLHNYIFDSCHWNLNGKHCFYEGIGWRKFHFCSLHHVPGSPKIPKNAISIDMSSN